MMQSTPTGKPDAQVALVATHSDDVARARLLDRLDRSLLAGHAIHMPDQEYRLLRRGELILEGENELEALQTGIYGRMKVQHGLQRGSDPEVVEFTWGYFVALGHARSFFNQCLDRMPHAEQEALMVQLAARAALLSMQPNRSRTEPVAADVAGDEPAADGGEAAGGDRPSVG